MKRSEIWQAVELELRRHKSSKPNWPVHVVAQAGMVAAETCDLLNEAINNKYEGNPNNEQLKAAALRTIATAIRFLENQ